MNMWVGAWRKGGGGRVISDCSKKTKQNSNNFIDRECASCANSYLVVPESAKKKVELKYKALS